MKRQDTELHIRIDPLQPDGQNWLQAEATQGDVEARIDIRPYSDVRYPGSYVLDYYYDRANHTAAGTMGRRQEERAKALMQLLGQRVTEAMQEQGWRVLGKTSTGATVWQYRGPAAREQEQQLAQAATQIWHGRYPHTGAEKVAPLADFPVFRALLAKRWHPVGEGLETWVDYAAGQVQVRHQRQAGIPAQPPMASREVATGAYSRTIRTRPVTFICAWCQKLVTQQRYPGPKPTYCSDTCKAEATREQTRVRVQRYRAQAKKPGNH